MQSINNLKITMKFSPHFSETPSVLIQKVITNGLINEVAILLLTFYPWILFGCCEMVAGAFPQQSLKISQRRIMTKIT